MTKLFSAIALTAAFGAFATVAPAAHAAGCLSGAAVGGVAGHVAGHHGVLGAAAGCAIGHHEAKKQDRAAQRANANAMPQDNGSRN